jgi:hypothetical protein
MIVTVTLKLSVVKIDDQNGIVYAQRGASIDPENPQTIQKLTFPKETINIVNLGDVVDVQISDVDMVPA